MNRTERLYALVEELRARAPRPVPTETLAERFEVSVRTIMRDLHALQESGVPIWAQPGPGGGYALDPKRTLKPVNFSASEATAIGMALASSGAMPFSRAGRSALRKLVGAMAGSDSDLAARLATRVWVASEQPTTLEKRAAREVEDAVENAETVRLTYRDREGRTTTRVVEAQGILGSRRGWYLVAWDRDAGGGRSFRLDRIVAVERTGQTAQPRELESLIGWALPISRPVVSLVRPERWEGRPVELTEILERFDADRARWLAALDAVPKGRMLEGGVCGTWSVRDVTNHVNVYHRFALFQYQHAFSGAPEEMDWWPWMGDRVQPPGEYPDTTDGRNALFQEAGKHLSLETLLEENARAANEFRAWIAGRSPPELAEGIGWVPYWTGAPREDSRLLRLASDVAGLSQVEPLWSRAVNYHAHALSHAREFLAALGVSDVREEARREL